DVAGNVRGHQTSCKEPSKGSLEQKHDYSNVQEAKYIDMAKDNAKKTSCSVQNNETIKLVLYGYRTQRNINNAMKINSTYVIANLVVDSTP
ncbi:hypothetical protein HMPREF6745_1700, partial [Prevotella sp. oral taxon 472 str. F0295]